MAKLHQNFIWQRQNAGRQPSQTGILLKKQPIDKKTGPALKNSVCWIVLGAG